MFKTIQQYLALWTAYPIIAGILTIIGGLFIYKYRKILNIYILKKLKIKINKTKSLTDFTEKSGYFYDFKEETIISDYDDFYKALKKQVKKSRKTNTSIKFNLSKVKTINVIAEEAIRDIIREMVMNNNIQCKVIFPSTGMNNLYKELDKFVKEKSSKSVELQKAKKQRKKK